jgi:murein L,D-transpeptidase YafK
MTSKHIREFWRGAGRWRRAVVLTTTGFLAIFFALFLCVSHFACSGQSIPNVPIIGEPELRVDHPRVLVEKSAHRLSLFDGNQLVKAWRVAIGGGQGDKVKEGDKCTPVGDFFVCYRNPNSKYTLSLGLSYPNEEDAARGLADGLVTQTQHDAIVAAAGGRSYDANTWEALWKTPLGGEIMIHGHGAGRDWTLGCVAMDDDAIRQLYRVLPYGTPVKIVP